MKVDLNPAFFLSDERAESPYGWPVLVSRRSGGVYGPRDIIKISGKFYFGSVALKRMVRNRKFSKEEKEFIENSNTPWCELVNWGQTCTIDWISMPALLPTLERSRANGGPPSKRHPTASDSG